MAPQTDESSNRPAGILDTDEMKAVTESLYKQNLELAVKNKTLSLLEKLYQISILNLESAEIAGRISKSIQEDFSFEHVGILRYEQPKGTLHTIGRAESKRFEDARSGAEYCFDKDVPNVLANAFFEHIISEKRMAYTEKLSDVWGAHCPPELLASLEEKAHAHSVVAYPLFIEDKVIGICLLVLNRSFTELPDYEKAAIQSVANVIGVALDKAMLYEQLRESNEELADKNIRLRELDQMKTEFVSIASHQLRAPITAIKGYASLILEGSFGQVPATLSEAIDRIFQSSKSMATSIDDFLNVSRIEQGRMKYDFKEVDIAAIAKQTYTEFLPLAEKKKLQLTFTEGEHYVVKTDENKAKQIITNLIDNAIKYTPKGTVTIKLSKNSDTGKVLISITDSGIGISVEDQEKLFSKFTRAANANTANVQGTGLGLYVAREMARAMRGDITLSSEGAGKGSTFVFEIPG